LNLSKLYFATDLSPGDWKSVTYRAQPDHELVYGKLIDQLNPIVYTVDKTKFDTFGDSGVVGIIEKLICVESFYFMGLQGQCAKYVNC